MISVKFLLALLPAFMAISASPTPEVERRFTHVGACSPTQSGCGPNGGEDWFNTGMDGDGWKPPFMSLADVKHISIDDFYAGAGAACKKYTQHLHTAATEGGVDEAIIAAIAMQESSCDATATGPTPGLMQVACDNYPDDTNGCKTKCRNQQPVNGNCLAINLRTAINVLKSNIDNAGGNFIQAIGEYNGWFVAGSGLNNNKGMTYSWPCSKKALNGGNGHQNVDYIHQTLNGWFQGINVYNQNPETGKYESTYGKCGT